MPSGVKPSPESTETSQDMGHLLGQERRLTQKQSLNAIKEKVPLPWREKSSFSQESNKVGLSFGLPYLEQTCESTRNASTERITRPKSSSNDLKSLIGDRAYDDNELVKHMSNLPGFLQRVEKECSIQEKALNFGVLDWTRLEKWKYTERMPGKHLKKTSSSSASGSPKMGPILRKQPSSHGRNPSSLYSGKQPLPHVSRFSSPQRQPPPPHSSHVNSSKEETNAHKEEKYFERIKSKGKETCNKEDQVAECSRIGGKQDHFHQKVKFRERNCSETIVYNSKKNNSKQEMLSEKQELGKHEFSLPSHEENDAQEKQSEMRLDGGITSECYPAKPQNIVLLVPKHFPKRRCSESSQFTELRTSLDGQLAEVTGNRLSDFFSSQELYSGGSAADIPHSCPLPSGAMEPHNLVIDSDICPNANSVSSITFESNSTMHEETAKPSPPIEASDEKQADVARKPTAKGRAPSPARRLSFSLGKMSRSFSFKESSAVPELSSTYTAVNSGPVRSQVSSNMENLEKDHAHPSNRSRSSPLRRLLDPLLKHKATQSAETVCPPKGSSHSKAPSQDRKPEAPTFQALLQLTLKSGLPFFKLVVENSNDMLAAGVKKLPASGKSDSCMVYAFYSVHEIRKKSMNWMNQGSKSKSCSLGYNIVGQMKISYSYNLTVNGLGSNDCVARECVLYGVDPGSADKPTLEFVPNKEIAAIIVKNSIKKLNDGELSDAATFETRGNNTSNGTIVILPGGVHGTPIKGAPSPLISRWRTGGLCDCGGWDVGCKLHILADNEKSSNTSQALSSSAVDHLNLFVQGGERNSKPIFSLKPCKSGFYSIELDASISLLEAFATCVAYVTCCKFPELIDDNNGRSDAEHCPEVLVGTDKRKTQNTFQEQIPAKYVTCPPLSPVGRI